MARARVHQHVNPLAKYYRELPVEPLSLVDRFANPSLPLLVDIGCARGRFVLEMARLDEEQNFLGIEIREPLVIDANQIRDEEGLGNLHYVFCNAMLDLKILFSKFPDSILKMVTIQFPDPWFKKKHAKRRMVKDALVHAIADHLAPEGEVLLQTDVEFVAEEMTEIFSGSGRFDLNTIHENPLHVKTERELAVEKKGLPVYRYIAKRKT
jgi:tRNA (guanine-N7-)-methyltransferase